MVGNWAFWVCVGDKNFMMARSMPCRGGKCFIRGAGSPCRGGECFIRGAGSPCRGEKCFIRGAGSPCRGGFSFASWFFEAALTPTMRRAVRASVRGADLAERATRNCALYRPRCPPCPARPPASVLVPRARQALGPHGAEQPVGAQAPQRHPHDAHRDPAERGHGLVEDEHGDEQLQGGPQVL